MALNKYPTPAREGHWWAKLRLAENPDDNSTDWGMIAACLVIGALWPKERR